MSSFNIMSYIFCSFSIWTTEKLSIVWFWVSGSVFGSTPISCIIASNVWTNWKTSLRSFGFSDGNHCFCQVFSGICLLIDFIYEYFIPLKSACDCSVGNSGDLSYWWYCSGIREGGSPAKCCSDWLWFVFNCILISS